MDNRTLRSAACSCVAALTCFGCSGWQGPPNFHRRVEAHIATLDSSFAEETVPLTDGAVYLVTGSGIWYVRDTIAERVRPAEAIADSTRSSFGADFELTPTLGGRAYGTPLSGGSTWLLDGATAVRVHERAARFPATHALALPSTSLLFAQYVTTAGRLRDCERAEDARGQPEDYDDDQ